MLIWGLKANNKHMQRIAFQYIHLLYCCTNSTVVCQINLGYQWIFTALELEAIIFDSLSQADNYVLSMAYHSWVFPILSSLCQQAKHRKLKQWTDEDMNILDTVVPFSSTNICQCWSFTFCTITAAVFNFYFFAQVMDISFFRSTVKLYKAKDNYIC